MAMEWQFIDTHPSGLTGQHNLFYEGDVEFGQQHGHGVKTNKIDKTKYTGGFVRGKKEDDNATQIEIDQINGNVQVYNGPFQNDEKHGLGQMIIENKVYTVRYDKGIQKSITLKNNKQISNCQIF